MNWEVILSALGLLISLGSLIIGTYASLARKIQSIDSRLSKLEGRFEERGYWESREFRPKLKGEDE